MWMLLNGSNLSELHLFLSYLCDKTNYSLTQMITAFGNWPKTCWEKKKCLKLLKQSAAISDKFSLWFQGKHPGKNTQLIQDIDYVLDCCYTMTRP